MLNPLVGMGEYYIASADHASRKNKKGGPKAALMIQCGDGYF